MADVFLEKIKNYQHLNNNQTCNSKKLFMLDEGIYILDDAPTVDMIRIFLNFKGELGTLLINNIWFLSISYKKRPIFPQI